MDITEISKCTGRRHQATLHMEIRQKPLYDTFQTIAVYSRERQGMEVISAKQKHISEPPTNLDHWSEMKY